MTTDFEATLAGVLAGHVRSVRNGRCSCGEWRPLWPTETHGSEGDQYRAHQAAMLSPLIAEAQAVALEEAVSDFESNVGVGEFDELTRTSHSYFSHIEEAWEHQSAYMAWLSNRAARLREP